jgi:hypothetical protein
MSQANEGKTSKVNEVIIDSVRDNAIKIVDEATRLQPQLTHSISSFQVEYIDSARSLIASSFASQKPVLEALTAPLFLRELSERVASQSAVTMTDTIRSVNTLSAIGANVLDLARENLKIYSTTFNAAVEYNMDVLKTWASFWSPKS